MTEHYNFLTTEQVSGLLGVHIRTVQRLTKQGRLKAIRIGRLWKYEKTVISNFISSARKTNPQERRAYPRINSNFDCNYSVNLLPFSDIQNKGFIRNLSAGGVLLYAEEGLGKINVDDPIDLSFSLEKLNLLNINVTGKVVRKTNDSVGIKFKSIDREARKRIRKYAE